MSSIWFRMMALEFKIRDSVKPRRDIIKEVELQEGFQVLDFGCGPGGYVIAASESVGASGKLYALDTMPIALGMVRKIVDKKKLANVTTIQSDCNTGLQDEELDVVLLYDVFHDLADQNAVLSELHRILKPNGALSFSDHHLSENEIVSRITSSGLFNLLRKNQRTYTFSKTKKAN
jgi:ubiquinone/menaquinone biosynthesis C-methylase UbiE